MRRTRRHDDDGGDVIPGKGDRIELLRPRMGVRVRATVFYSDQLQILVKSALGPSGPRHRVDSGQYQR